MPSHTNKISDNGYIYKYNDKNSRKLLTFERDTTTISSEGNETKSWSLGRKNGLSATKPLKGRHSLFIPEHQITPPSAENRSHSRQRAGITVFSWVSK